MYKRIFDKCPDGIIVTDMNGRILKANKSACKLFGYKKDELIGKYTFEFSIKSKFRKDLKIFRNLAERGFTIHETYIKNKNGKIIPVEIVAFTLGKNSAVGFIKDITQRKELWKEMIAEKERFKTIIESMEDGLVVVSKDRIIQLMNRALRREFGNAVGKKCHEIFFDRNAPCPDCLLEKIIEEGKVVIRERRPKNGKIYLCTSSRFRNPDGSFSRVTIMKDITELKNKEKELKKKIKELEEFYEMAVDRELRIIELKKEIERLKEELLKFKKLTQKHS